MLNEGMQLQWNYFTDGSPSAFTNIDGGTLEVTYVAPMDYAIYAHGEYLGSSFSLKSGMKLAERRYKR
jgi:hypothetical protein